MKGIHEFVLNQVSPLDGIEGMQPIVAGVRRAMGAYEKLANDRAKVNSDPNLSDAGKRSKLLDGAKADMHEVVRARKLADAAKANGAKRRERLQPPAIDKTDSAAATVRGQIRLKLENMGKVERKVFLSTTNDPAYFQAVLEAPSELSGVDAETRAMVHARAVDAANPGALQRLEQTGEAVQLLDVAARVLNEHFAEAVELPPNAMDEFVRGVIPDQRHLEAEAARLASAIAA
jgi:hypothetical protein